jgi:hypothetical protein
VSACLAQLSLEKRDELIKLPLTIISD